MFVKIKGFKEIILKQNILKKDAFKWISKTHAIAQVPRIIRYSNRIWIRAAV